MTAHYKVEVKRVKNNKKKMAKLSYNTPDYSGLNCHLIGLISTFCVLFGMIVTVLGIKFKWFKHRMNFEQLPQQSENNNNSGGDKFRNTSEKRSSLTTMQCQGIFRKLGDDEIPIDRPKSLPPIRIKNTSQQQLHLAPAKVHHKNDNSHNPLQYSTPLEQQNQQIPMPQTREIFKNMKFNTFPTDNDLIPPVHHHNQQKPITKSKQHDQRSKSPKKNSSPNKTSKPKPQIIQNFPPNKTNNTTQSQQQNQLQTHHRTKSPQKIQSKEVEQVKNADGEKRIKKSTKTTNFLKLDIEATKSGNSNVNSTQFQKPKEEKNVKFADNTPVQIYDRHQTEHLHRIDDDDDDEELKQISTRRATGYVRPTKEEIEELENFDNIINGIDKEQEQYPGTLQEKNGRLVFKIEGLSDNEEEDEKIAIKTIPTPEPRKSLEKQLDNDNGESINLMPLSLLNGGQNSTDDEIDSWSAVRQHRNLTQEMAKHHQAIRDAAQIKAAKRQLKNPLAYDLDTNKKSLHFNHEQEKQQKDNNAIHPRLSNNSTEA